jgi:hypothetical protein
VWRILHVLRIEGFGAKVKRESMLNGYPVGGHGAQKWRTTRIEEGKDLTGRMTLTWRWCGQGIGDGTQVFCYDVSDVEVGVGVTQHADVFVASILRVEFFGNLDHFGFGETHGPAPSSSHFFVKRGQRVRELRDPVNHRPSVAESNRDRGWNLEQLCKVGEGELLLRWDVDGHVVLMLMLELVMLERHAEGGNVRFCGPVGEEFKSVRTVGRAI